MLPKPLRSSPRASCMMPLALTTLTSRASHSQHAAAESGTDESEDESEEDSEQTEEERQANRLERARQQAEAKAWRAFEPSLAEAVLQARIATIEAGLTPAAAKEASLHVKHAMGQAFVERHVQLSPVQTTAIAQATAGAIKCAIYEQQTVEAARNAALAAAQAQAQTLGATESELSEWRSVHMSNRRRRLHDKLQAVAGAACPCERARAQGSNHGEACTLCHMTCVYTVPLSAAGEPESIASYYARAPWRMEPHRLAASRSCMRWELPQGAWLRERLLID